MSTLRKKILWSLSLLLALILCFVAYLIATERGLKTLIHLSAWYFNQNIEVRGVHGSLRNRVTIDELDYHTGALTVRIKNSEFAWTLHSLKNHNWAIDTVHAETVEFIEKDRVNTLSKVNGSAYFYKDMIYLNALQFNYAQINVVTNVRLKNKAPYPFTSTIKLVPQSKNRHLPEGAFTLTGNREQMHWDGHLQGFGALKIQGHLNKGAKFYQNITWNNLKKPNSRETIEWSKEGSLTLSGTWPQLTTRITAQVNAQEAGEWQLEGSIKGALPWSWDVAMHATPVAASSSSQQPDLRTRLTLTGRLEQENKGIVHIKIDPGYYQLTKQNPMRSLSFKGGELTTQLSAKGLSGSGYLNLDENKSIKSRFDLPQFNLSQGISDAQKLSSEVVLTLNSLEFLEALIPELKNPQGLVQMSLTTNGTIKKPIIKTQLNLTHASAELPSLGLKLQAIECTLNSTKERWYGRGSIRSGNQVVALKGEGRLLPQITGEVAIEGDNVPLINTKEYTINLSPKVQVRFNPEEVQVLGTVLIPYAQIKIHSFSNSIGLSNDVVFERQKQKPSAPSRNTIDLRIRAGEQVELDAKGLHATLAGTVHVRQSPQSALSATGELNVVKGQYQAYGQNLAIEQGELFFTGGAIDNPGINLRASKTINTSTSSSGGTNPLLDLNSTDLQNASLRGAITVGVEVTGRLLTPEVQLFSNPPLLSQADILSMLVLGRPASQANKAGGQLLIAAISSMGDNSKGTQLLEQLKNNLGIDFNVETNSNYNVLTNTVDDKTAFVVSKAISKRISLSYNVGLAQTDPNVVTLKYLLTKFFSIQVSSSGTSSGLDVFYTSTKN